MLVFAKDRRFKTAPIITSLDHQKSISPHQKPQCLIISCSMVPEWVYIHTVAAVNLQAMLHKPWQHSSPPACSKGRSSSILKYRLSLQSCRTAVACLIKHVAILLGCMATAVCPQIHSSLQHRMQLVLQRHIGVHNSSVHYRYLEQSTTLLS